MPQASGRGMELPVAQGGKKAADSSAISRDDIPTAVMVRLPPFRHLGGTDAGRRLAASHSGAGRGGQPREVSARLPLQAAFSETGFPRLLLAGYSFLFSFFVDRDEWQWSFQKGRIEDFTL
jgi:hypothetical protein